MSVNSHKIDWEDNIIRAQIGFGVIMIALILAIIALKFVS